MWKACGRLWNRAKFFSMFKYREERFCIRYLFRIIVFFLNYNIFNTFPGLEGEYGFQADNGKISYKFPKGEKCSNDREFSLRLVIECGTDDQLKYNFLKDV